MTRRKVHGRTPCVCVLGLIFAFLAAVHPVASTAARAFEQPTLEAALAANSDTPVDIPDAALRKALEKALGKGAGERITRGEMADLRGNLDVNGVEQLAGIEHAVNLESLGVRQGMVSDVSPLSGLTSLRALYLSNNEISDVSPLSGLTFLRLLFLGNNEISDVSPLSGLTSLSSLYLSNNEISDVSPLSGLTSLGDLSLHGNEVSDVSPLSRLTSLYQLRLPANKISDVSPLSGLTFLRLLSLGNNEISDVSPLSGLTSLSSLYLSNNEISDVSPLSGLTSLKTLYLIGNKISDMSPLSGLTSLEGLHLGDNPIWDVSPLSGLTSLRSLTLGGCSIGSTSDISPLAELTSLRYLVLVNNGISDVSPLLRNTGLGDGDELDLRGNLLSAESIETHVPTLLERGVNVRFDPMPTVPDGAEVAEISDPALRSALEATLRKGAGWPITVDELSNLNDLDGTSRGIGDLSGLELATGLVRVNLSGNAIADLAPVGDLISLRFLDANGNDIKDIAPVAGLPLEALSLRDNKIEDLLPIADLDRLRYLALDDNLVRELPTLPDSLEYLYLTDNSISDITALTNLTSLEELRLSGNSITSLAPLAGKQLAYLDLNDNQVADIASLNFHTLVELHMRNNAVQDVSPLLSGDQLTMVDVRGNLLSSEAENVLRSLREAGVTVLAGEAVPYFPTAGAARAGFVRIVNRSDADGEVFIEAVDDAGVRFGPVRLAVGARRTIHFNSTDLENGNAGKGLAGGVGRPTAGDWRLEVMSPLGIEVLSYVRTEDGFVTAMHDVMPDAVLPTFNPGSNTRQRSILRIVNTEAEWAKWVTGGYDDRGAWHPMTGSIEVRPGRALTLTAQALENAHGLGDGHGKWRLRVRGFPWLAMSLLDSPTGHLTNLSTVPDNVEPLADGASRHRVPLFPAAGGSRQGFLRVINRSNRSGEVAIEAVDDEGNRFGPVQLEMRARRTAHFNSDDMEAGNAAKGLFGGVGVGDGDWRLELTSELDLRVLSYVRTTDGFLTSMHDLAPRAADGSHRVVFFNPGGNTRQVSKLRLINNGDRAASMTIAGIDDSGSDSGTVALTVPAAQALTFTSAQLEAGGERLSGGLGDGTGKWRLRVNSDVPVAVMSLLESPTGHLTNVSTGTED